jgi:iron complex transport system substrate-binding protein
VPTNCSHTTTSRRFFRCVVGWWLLTLAWSCTAHARDVLRDDSGRAIELSKPPQRIVSLLPSLTETVCVLGACSRLVGVDRYSNWPASVQSLPRMGGGIDPNIEAIVSARPDVVLLAGSTRGGERLESMGLKVIRLEPRSLAEARRVLFTVASMLGLPSAEGIRVWREIESRWAAAAESLPPTMRGKSVYFEVSPVPYAAGPTSFIGETLTHLGLLNIMPTNMGPFPKINPEFVVRAQPDIVMLGDSSQTTLLQRPGWKSLQAIKQDQLCVFDQDASDVLVRAGPRLAEAAQHIVGCLQRLSKVSP